MMLNKNKILELFGKLDNKLLASNLVGEIGVVGGAAMCLLFNERASTKDVDAIFEPSFKIKEMAAEMAEEENLQKDWLNDAVKGFLSPQPPQEEIIYNGKALKVWIPNLEYLFAMKALASRVDGTDKRDIELLIKKMGLTSLEQAIIILHGYYPKGQINQKTYYFLEEIFEKSQSLAEIVYAMSNIRPKDTGLGMVIWITPKTGNERHGPRIKVQKQYGDASSPQNWFSMTISNIPETIGDTGQITTRDITKVKEFVILNKEILLQHWNDEKDAKETLNALVKLP